MRQKITKLITICCLGLAVLLASGTSAQAKYIEGKYVSYENIDTVSVGYAYNYAKGGDSYTYIQLKDGATITNVKSSSKNLLAKITADNYSINSEYSYDPVTYESKYTRTKKVSSQYISYFAKKSGKYKVTFDVVDKDGVVVEKGSITVKTYASATKQPVKRITYNGKDVYEYIYCTQKSGKIKVTMNKGFSLVKIEVDKVGKGGVISPAKIRNNAKVSLITSRYSLESSSDYYTRESDPIFPYTYIYITYKDNKTKEIDTVNYSLCTMNTKGKIK